MKSEILYSDGIYFLYSIFDGLLRQRIKVQTGGIKNARLELSNRVFAFGEFYAVICASLMVLSVAS